MTKITTDFVGTENIAVTKQRLTDILAYWGASTAAYTTWGQARTAMNALLTSTTAGTIGATELAGSFLPKINFLNDPDDMVLDALFGAGEQGVWLDPSDVANVDWRRNLLTYSEQFDNAAWQIARATKGSAQLDPNGGMTAIRITATSAAGDLYRGGISSENVTHTNSVWLRRVSGTGDIQLGTPANGTITMAVTSSWQRFSTNGLPFSGTTAFLVIRILTSGDVIDVAFAQQELGSTATDYQRITDLNTEVIERFPNATMYQDAAGTTPVYAPGQPVGLRLDKSKGLVPGPELVVNGDFVSSGGWTGAAGVSFTVGFAEFANVSSSSALYRAASVVIGKTYEFTIVVSSRTAGSIVPRLFGGSSSTVEITAAGTYRFIDQVTTANTNVGCIANAFTGSIDNISVKELPGNHATQSTLGSRPMYGIEPKGGRRNLLTYSEQFDNAVWTKTTGTTVTGNQTAAPDGTTTADLAVGNGSSGVFVSAISVSTTAANTKSVYLRGVSGGEVVQLKDPSQTLGTTTCTLTTTWQRFSLSETQTNGTAGLWVANIPAGGIYVWGAQLEQSATATNYQRVTTAFDVTEAGVNTCHYCEYDGIDDGMITNSIDFTATDKMSVFAGVRKLSDATFGMVTELSPFVVTNNGSFYIGNGTSSGGGASYSFGSRGSIIANTTSPLSFASPISNVITGLGDISGDLATIRINGTQAAQSTADQGTGNYGNYRLNIGRRGNDQPTPSLPLKGRDYGIIVTGKLANATAIATTEMWLANKTSGVTL